MASLPGASGTSGVGHTQPPPVYEKTTNCKFTDYGCKTTQISRRLVNAHELQCAFDPSPEGISFCQTFDATKACNFRICPKSVMWDTQHTNDVLDHLTCGDTHNLPFQRVKLGDNVNLRFRLPTSLLNEPTFTPVHLFEVYRGATQQIVVGYYALVQRVTMPWLQNLSWAVVGFNARPNPLVSKQYQCNRKVAAKLSIIPKTDPSKVKKDGDRCIPNQIWTVKSIFLKDWDEFMRLPEEQRPVFSYNLPVIFLADYYEQEDRTCEMTVSFGPIVV